MPVEKPVIAWGDYGSKGCGFSGNPKAKTTVLTTRLN